MESKIKSLVKGIDEAKRRVRVLASDSTLDRDGERILPDAFKKHLKKYKDNPVIMACHAHRLEDGKSPVVGRCVSIWIDKKGLWAVIEFAETELGEEYWQLYKTECMRAVSVGFIPLAWRDEKENGKGVRIITEAELFEISCVPVPSNPNALVKNKKRKIDFINAKKENRYLQHIKKLSEESESEATREYYKREYKYWTDPEFRQKESEEFAEVLMCSDEEFEEKCGIVSEDEELCGISEESLRNIIGGVIGNQKKTDFMRHFAF